MSGILENLSQKISSQVENTDQNVLMYGMVSLFGFIAGYSVLAGLSYMMNIFACTMTAAVSSSLLRVFTGGSHAGSPVRCIITGTAVFLALGKGAQYLSLSDWAWLYSIIPGSVGLGGILIIYKYGYATTHKKYLGSYGHGRKLRSAAIALMAAWLAAVYGMVITAPLNAGGRVFIVASLLGVTWQIFSMTTAGYRVSNAADVLLQRVGVR